MKMAGEEMNLINQYQLLQQQLQAIIMQKEDSKLELMENEKALEEIKKSDVKEVYKIVGQIMIKKDVEEAKKELEEKISDLEIRLSAFEKTEQKINDKLKELEPKIQKMLTG
ncbi:MAG: prefoldin subunit beta [Candidatus Aenigmarchaeota archaeon]|nr:prefoldin subunit beta [Candidatus Aenigmarchaeota archaeon]